MLGKIQKIVIKQRAFMKFYVFVKTIKKLKLILHIIVLNDLMT